MLVKPLRRGTGNQFDCARLGKQMCGPRDDLKLFIAAQQVQRLSVQFKYRGIVATNDQERRGSDLTEIKFGQVGATTA